jgi:hypothetical protein
VTVPSVVSTAVPSVASTAVPSVVSEVVLSLVSAAESVTLLQVQTAHINWSYKATDDNVMVEVNMFMARGRGTGRHAAAVRLYDNRDITAR